MPALERTSTNALALHYAAARGCVDCVRLLVNSSDSPRFGANSQMENDVTPVYLAAQEGHLDILKFLVLEAGGSLYICAKDGMGPIHAAAQMGNLSCIKWMVKDQGVDPNMKDGDGATALHFAASRGHVETVRWLLRHGAKLLQDKYQRTPINDAAENQQTECLNILVQHGTAPDYYEETNGKLHGCICRKGDTNSKCSYADCVNYKNNREPFYLHPPSLPERNTKNHVSHRSCYLINGSAPKSNNKSHNACGRTNSPKTTNGLFINPMSPLPSSPPHAHLLHYTDPFYLHNPKDVCYNRVKDVFCNGKIPLSSSPSPSPSDKSRDLNSEDSDTSSMSSSTTVRPTTSITGLTVKVEVHSSSSGACSNENRSSPELSSPESGRVTATENEYEDIYAVGKESTPQNDEKLDPGRVRRESKDSGSHSRSESVSSTNSNIPHGEPCASKQIADVTHDDIVVSGESGVSSASPSDLGHSEEEQEILKTRTHHTLPHQLSNHRILKRVVSEPVALYTPPPPPPLPPPNLPIRPNSDEDRSKINNRATNVIISSSESASGCSKITGVVYKKNVCYENETHGVSKILTTEESGGDSQNSSSSFISNEESNTSNVTSQPSSSEFSVSSPTNERSMLVVTTSSSVEHSASEVNGVSPPHLVNKQLVLPFIPPKFSNIDNDSNSLLKPSEYLRSIANGKAPKVKPKSEPETNVVYEERATVLIKNTVLKSAVKNPPSASMPDTSETSSTSVTKSQPLLSSVSAQELTKVQLRQVDKVVATKTMSAPNAPNAVTQQPYLTQKQDLIAELKMSKDIVGIKKLKVERVKMEEKQEKQMVTEKSKQFSVENFVEKIPSTDATGNPIPPWKRQMMAKKAAEKAKKELEEQLAREAEERRLQAIPAWKRQLMQSRKSEEKCVISSAIKEEAVDAATTVKVTITSETENNNCNSDKNKNNRGEEQETNKENNEPVTSNNDEENDKCKQQKQEEQEEEEIRIIPWRAQLRKTNSKLNLLD